MRFACKQHPGGRDVTTDWVCVLIAYHPTHSSNISSSSPLTPNASVVDWDWTFEAPLPAIVQFPWFIADVPGWHNDGTSPGDSFRQNRDYLVQTLKTAEMSETGSDKLSVLLASARERQIFQSAINFRDKHKESVAEDQKYQVARHKDVRGELEAFLVKHPDMRDKHEVKLIMVSEQ